MGKWGLTVFYFLWRMYGEKEKRQKRQVGVLSWGSDFFFLPPSGSLHLVLYVSLLNRFCSVTKYAPGLDLPTAKPATAYLCLHVPGIVTFSVLGLVLPAGGKGRTGREASRINQTPPGTLSA